MKTDNIITKIWEIRGLLDASVSNRDRCLFEQAYQQFEDICKNKSYITSASISIGKSFVSNEEVLSDIQKNFNNIAYDFNAVIAGLYSDLTKVNPLERKANSIIELVWSNRGKFDILIKKIKQLKSDEQEVKRVFAQLKSNISLLCEYAKHSPSKTFEADLMALLNIHQEIENKEQECLRSVRAQTI